MLDKFRSIDITWDKANRNIYKRIRAASSDDNGRKLIVQVIDNGKVANLDAVDLRLYWEHNKHKGYHDFEAVNTEEGIFQVYFTREMLEHTGKHKVWLHLTDLTGSVTSEPFGVEVFQGIDLDALEDTSEFSALNQALTRVVDIEEREQARQDEFEVNEADRQAEFDSNETDRQENEDERISNENARKSQESSRVTSEDTRKSEETSRQDNEADRVDAESSRASAESTRVSNEATRKANETNRQNAEDSRESNEDDRESNERTRITNENNRAQSAQELEETYAPRLTEVEQKTNDEVYTVDNNLVDFKNEVTQNGFPWGVESGSNDDGYWWILPSGLQVCFSDNFKIEYNTGTTLLNTWTYPKSFLGRPAVFSNPEGTPLVPHRSLTPFLMSRTNVSVTLQMSRITGTTDFSEGDSRNINVFAIGR